MAIKGLASITSPISKPLKDSGSLWVGIRDLVPCQTARGVREPEDLVHTVCVQLAELWDKISESNEDRQKTGTADKKEYC